MMKKSLLLFVLLGAAVHGDAHVHEGRLRVADLAELLHVEVELRLPVLVGGSDDLCLQLLLVLGLLDVEVIADAIEAEVYKWLHHDPELKDADDHD